MTPLNDYVLIETIEDRVTSRIVIEEDKKPQRGKVIEGKLKGEFVIFKRWSGIEIGKNLLVKFEDILAKE